MTDSVLIIALTRLRDRLVVALADVERGDHLRAAEALTEAHADLTLALDEIREAA